MQDEQRTDAQPTGESAPAAAAADPAQGGPPASRVLHELYEWVEWGLGVCILAVLLLTFLVRTVGVYGISMEPTLYEGDSLLATRLLPVENGDIVAITQPNATHMPLIKRVIATAGQTIDIDFDTGDVTVNGTVLQEPYIAERILPDTEDDVQFPLTVPEGHVFVMGDNRNNSWDSRSGAIGMIDERYLLGKVVLRIGPPSRFGRLQVNAD